MKTCFHQKGEKETEDPAQPDTGF